MTNKFSNNNMIYIFFLMNGFFNRNYFKIQSREMNVFFVEHTPNYYYFNLVM